MKRLHCCTNCGSTESAMVYANDPYCSEGCRKVIEGEMTEADRLRSTWHNEKRLKHDT